MVFFGRDDYENKTCVLVAPKYAVFEHWESGTATTLNYTDGIEDYIENWKVEVTE